MTEQERATLKAQTGAVTPGPCRVVVCYLSRQSEIQSGPDEGPREAIGALNHADAVFYVAARSAVPALLAENDALRALVGEFSNGTVGDAEPATHYNRRGEWECNYCKAHSSDITKLEHAADCPVLRGQALLGGAQ